MPSPRPSYVPRMISNQRRWYVAAFALGLFAAAAQPAVAADAKAGASNTKGWFQYRGPSRDGISVETGLTKTFGPQGPKTLWRIPIGAGFSAVSVVGDRLYTMHAEGGQEFAICLDAGTGRKIWSTQIGAIFNNEYGDGPRSTPTVEGDVAYVHGSQGRLAALKLADGSTIWQVELRQAFEGDLPTWAFTSAPLLMGDVVIIESGGKGARAVAACLRSNPDPRSPRSTRRRRCGASSMASAPNDCSSSRPKCGRTGCCVHASRKSRSPSSVRDCPSARPGAIAVWVRDSGVW